MKNSKNIKLMILVICGIILTIVSIRILIFLLDLMSLNILIILNALITVAAVEISMPELI